MACYFKILTIFGNLQRGDYGVLKCVLHKRQLSKSYSIYQNTNQNCEAKKRNSYNSTEKPQKTAYIWAISALEKYNLRVEFEQ